MVSPAGQGHVRRHRLSLHFYDPPAVEGPVHVAMGPLFIVWTQGVKRDRRVAIIGFVKGILETGGVMDKCVQMWTRNYGALGQTARVCFGVLCANRTREVKRDFGDLPIRRSEGRVVNTALVFKRVLFEEEEKKRGQEKGQESQGERTDGRRRRDGKERGDGKRLKESRGERELSPP
ncbi:hypothetical protein TNCV_3030501 [Trichonephila clavipes]|nr:hypothetical protein TNCV_3030501 [Trichonephila clavipes]